MQRTIRCIWDQLQDNNMMLCPKCGYEWMPKDSTKRPVSCPVCKQYLIRYQEPEPAGWIRVSNRVWEREKF